MVLVLRRKKIELLMAVLIILVAILFSSVGVQIVDGKKVKNKKQTIVIDSGHGGIDSGKVSVLGDYEKDINLAIAKKLSSKLKKAGYNVVMTRTDDKGLYSDSSANKKTEDMRNRCNIIDSSGAVLAVSIHQNSYHQEGVKGAQVFFYKQSEQGEELAKCIQESLAEGLDKTNKRQAKSNDSYYLLRKTQTPTVIVECGFLSNYEEAGKLVGEDYQKQVAKAIFNGIENYLKHKN